MRAYALLELPKSVETMAHKIRLIERNDLAVVAKEKKASKKTKKTADISAEQGMSSLKNAVAAFKSVGFDINRCDAGTQKRLSPGGNAPIPSG